MDGKTIGFVGAGNMATSLVGGLIARGVAADHIWMGDPSVEHREAVASEHGVHVRADNREVAERADVLLLAVKPQVMGGACEPLRDILEQRQPLVISIAAGVTVAGLRGWIGDVPLVRCMPNTPALVQVGATGLYAAEGVNEAQKAIADQVLGAVGATFWFAQEQELDTVTAVSGSGPAYFFLLMEALIDAAVAQGLEPETARGLVLQTARGAAELAAASDVGPGVLRARVTSPGGTTAAALQVFEEAGLRDQIADAVAAAHARSRELA